MSQLPPAAEPLSFNGQPQATTSFNGQPQATLSFNGEPEATISFTIQPPEATISFTIQPQATAWLPTVASGWPLNDARVPDNDMRPSPNLRPSNKSNSNCLLPIRKLDSCNRHPD